MNSDFIFCRDECAKNDYAFYLLTLFRSRSRQPELWALGALRLQLENIITSATQPTLAYIRLTWWRDEVAKLSLGTYAKGQPLLQALALLSLSVEDLQNYINAFENLVEGGGDAHTQIFDELIAKILNDPKAFSKYQKQNALVKQLDAQYRGTKWQSHPPFLAIRLWLSGLL